MLYIHTGERPPERAEDYPGFAQMPPAQQEKLRVMTPKGSRGEWVGLRSIAGIPRRTYRVPGLLTAGASSTPDRLHIVRATRLGQERGLFLHGGAQLAVGLAGHLHGQQQ